LFDFSLDQIRNFLYTGYGAGAYETLYKIKATIIDSSYANHAHNEYLEYFGELGLVGSSLLLILIIWSLKKIFYKIKNNNDLIINFFPLFIILLTFLTTSFFDFSLHIPSIMYLIISIFSVCGSKK
jgi:O-antigen ligase